MPPTIQAETARTKRRNMQQAAGDGQRYPPPEAGIYVVRPPGQHPARKIRVLTEWLIEHFG